MARKDQLAAGLATAGRSGTGRVAGASSRSLTVVAEEIGVLAPGPQDTMVVELDTATPEPHAPPQTTTTGTPGISTERDKGDSDLAARLTGRKARKTETRGVTIMIPAELHDRIKWIGDAIILDPRLGDGIHPLNISSLIAEAAASFTAHPAGLAAWETSNLAGQRKLGGHVEIGTWGSMLRAWAGLPDRATTHGPHLIPQLEQIVTRLENWLSKA